MKLYSKQVSDYLASSDIIDFHEVSIQQLIQHFKQLNTNEINLINQVYEFVRDQISHSADINGKYVTCKASDVLKYKEGICYAKSHLLAAVLRGLDIPVGFCYQKLILNDDSAPYLILHGLNCVYISTHDKWIRLDSRGNKAGVDAQFSLEEEKLAFNIRNELNEEDIMINYPEPDINVIAALNKYSRVEDLFSHLPKELSL